MTQRMKVLISGASFAGLTTAYWMNKMGYEVTVVETGKHLKMGGTPVDIKDATVGIMARMGLLDKIKQNRLHLQKWEFKNAQDVTEHTLELQQLPENDFEIERDVLLHMLFDLIKHDVSFMFGNSIVALAETDHKMNVRFRDGQENEFDFVFGCDGIHSVVRRLWFGEEAQYVHYLGQYFSIAVLNEILIRDRTCQLYAEPNKGMMLHAYNGKTDVVFIFRPEDVIPYDYKDQQQQKQIVVNQMQGMKWRVAELRDKLLNAPDFYFDKFCQVKMTSWTRGRVALVGDAGYCASPAAGMGGSLAIIGATALADAFESNSDFQSAFDAYNKNLKPFIEEVQAGAVAMLDKLLPKTEEEVIERNRNGFSF